MYDYWRWDLDLCSRPGNNWSIKRISCQRWDKTEKIAPKSLKNQVHVDSFLRLSWCGSFRRDKLSTRNIIWTLHVICVKLFASRDRICGKTTLGFCTTIMRRLTLHSFFVTISPRTKKALKAIPEIEFNKCFDDWKKRCYKCIIEGGDYFEGDVIDLDK